MIWMRALVFGCVAMYAVVFWWAYATSVAPVFAYMGYTYQPWSAWAIVLCWLLAKR